MGSTGLISILGRAVLETLAMVGISVIVAQAVGTPLGILLVVTEEGHILPNRWVNRSLGTIINIGRSIPFIILLVAVLPFTRFLVGTTIGTKGMIVPLTVAAIPFVARVVESALKEVDPGVIEAALAMGSTPLQIVCKVLIPEAFPGLVLGFILTAVSLIGYSAMAGVVGGGGLGDLAYRYGFQRNRIDITWYTVTILVVLVQLLQMFGSWLAKKLSH